MPQTQAQKRADRTLARRKTSAYALVKRLAIEAGYDKIDEFLSDAESGNVVIAVTYSWDKFGKNRG